MRWGVSGVVWRSDFRGSVVWRGSARLRGGVLLLSGAVERRPDVARPLGMRPAGRPVTRRKRRHLCPLGAVRKLVLETVVTLVPMSMKRGGRHIGAW